MLTCVVIGRRAMACQITGMNRQRTAPRAALVTGATSGIGHAFAMALPESCALVLAGRDEAALERLHQELPGRQVQTVRADLATEDGLDVVCGAAERAEIDLLICNAGVGPYGDFLSAEETALRDTVSVNVLAPVVLLRRLLPGMLSRAEASGSRAGVVVLSSGTAFLPVPRLAAYAASKAFDLSLTEALGAELARRPVDVLAVCPSATRSRFAERSGFGRTPPLAQSPRYVAEQALSALGRQRTLVLGPVSGSIFTVPAVVRAGMAHALGVVLPRR